MVLFTQLLRQVYLSRRRYHMHLYKSKEKPPPKTRVADRSVDQMYVEPG